jgi:hypothetical protein
VALDDSPNYEALSYAWGSPERNIPILVRFSSLDSEADGTASQRALFITDHLVAALKRLRPRTGCRLIWIDQICINQEDPLEKNQQVQLMVNIYERADQTVVWLGEEDEDREVLEEMLEIFSRGLSVEEGRLLLGQMVDVSEPRNPATIRGQRREAMIRLMNRSWFSRAWIFQECVVSSNVQIVLGSIQVPFDQFVSLPTGLQSLEHDAGGYKNSIIKTTTGYSALSFTAYQRKLYQKREQRQGSFLGMLLHVTQNFTSTDVRDRVYSFLSFQDKDVTTPILPRYDLSVEAAYTNVARTAIENSGSLDVFGIVLGDLPRKHGHLFPSWVPDWTLSLPYSRPIAFSDLKTSFHACRDFTHKPIADPDPTKLTVRGIIVGSIDKIVPQSFDTGYYMDNMRDILRVKALYNWLNDYFMRYDPIYDCKRNRIDLLLDIFRTLLADGAFGDTQPLPHNLADLLQAHNQEETLSRMSAPSILPSGESNDSHGESAKKPVNLRQTFTDLRRYSLVVQRKRLFISDRRHLGLAPLSIREGDLICILYGSKTPCVLRPLEEQKKVGKEEYQVVCQCYLNGWMYGENPGSEVPWWEEEPQEFVLV